MIVNFFRSLCRRCRRERIYPFTQACEIGHLLSVKKCAEKNFKGENISEGMSIAMKNKYSQIVSTLAPFLDITEKNKFFVEACKLGHYELAEILAQNGATVEQGLRVTRSTNILRMLYRLKQNSEMIN